MLEEMPVIENVSEELEIINASFGSIKDSKYDLLPEINEEDPVEALKKLKEHNNSRIKNYQKHTVNNLN
jgi:hypothetical protein